MYIAQEKRSSSNDLVARTAGYMLLLPGKVLDISALNTSHKFRGRGNKGAVAAINELESASLGVVKEERATRGTTKVQYVWWW